MTEVLDQTVTDDFALYHSDCVDVLRGLPDESIHYSVFSPPFASLYTYSASPRDMGNVANHAEFFEQHAFLVDELYRVLKPGRLLSAHCMLLPTSKTRDGVIGLTDFRGDLIRQFQAAGFGDNQERVMHTDEDFPVSLWQKYASPVWMDIDPSDTLQFRSAREDDDERHVCPLQLEVIRRALKMWSNPGDTVLSPFAGIGSELYVALQEGRRAVGAELKRSYYDQAVRNLLSAASPAQQKLFGNVEVP